MAHIHAIEIINDQQYLIEPTLYIVPDKDGTAYTVNLVNFDLVIGVAVQAKFAVTNDANATLKINTGEAIPIYYNNTAITANQFKANHVYTLVYDGTKWQVVGDIGAAPAVEGGYLPLSGGTMTGALNAKNNTWNAIGDDAYLGDINKPGHIGIQGKNGNTGIFFTTYNQTTKTTGGAITWDGTKFSITSTTAVDASISGNAATASSVAWSNVEGHPTKLSQFTNDSGYTTNTGTVTQVSTGAGLIGGDITTTGTVKADLTNEEKLTNAAADGTETSGRVYPVRLDKNGKLAVNVPWTNINDSYLPLSGGTMTGNINLETNSSGDTNIDGTIILANSGTKIIQKMRNTSNWGMALAWDNTTTIGTTYLPGIGWHNQKASADASAENKGGITIIPYGTNTSPWGKSVGLFISKTDLKWEGKNIAYFTTATSSTTNGQILISDSTADGGIKNSGYTIKTSVPANAVFTDTNKYHTTGSWGGTNNLTYTATAVNSADALAFTLATASTSAYGVTKLSSVTDSDSEVLAATPKAIKTLNTKMDGLLAAANAMTFKGTIDSTNGSDADGSTNRKTLPATHNAGDTYRVAKEGTYAGKYCEIGTLIICVKDGTAAADADWTSVETNEDGSVIGATPTDSTDNAIAVWDGTSGRIIKSQSYVTYLNHAEVKRPDENTVIAHQDGLIIKGNSYGDAGQVLESQAGIIKYGDGGPQIQFITAQPAAIIYSHHDNTSGMQSAFHFVGEQTVAVKADALIAKTRAVFGAQKVNNDYVLYSNGATYINGNATMTGILNLAPGGSGEGGEIHLHAAEQATTKAGIVIDNYNSNMRIFGIQSADGSTKTGVGTPLIIDPYAKTITGGYTLTGALTGHASSDLALSGGKMTGRIYREGKSTNWNKGRDNALVATSTLSGYSPFASIKTTSGSWDIGAYNSSNYTDDLIFSYVTDTQYSGSPAVTTAQIKFLEDGHIVAELDGNATSATKATYLDNVGRLTSMDVDFSTYTNNSKFFISYADGNTTTHKPYQNAMILNVAWDNVNSNKYGAQIAIGNSTTPHLQLRGCANGTWDTDWSTVLDSNNTSAASSSDISVDWNTSTTIATINSTTVKIKIPDKPTYTYSDVGAAPDSTVSCTAANVQSILGINTSSGSTSKALTEQGTWEIFGTSNLAIGKTSTTAMAGNTTVTNVAISANVTTNANYPIVFATSNKDTTVAKNEGLQKSGAKFYFNPSTGNVVSTLFNNLTLTAATTGFTIAGGATSKTLTVAGTATINAPTQWGIVYGGASGAYTSTAAGTSGQYLKSNGNAAPTWATFSTSTVGLDNVTNDAQIPKSIGTTKGDIIYFDGSASPKRLAIGTNGQVLKIANGIPSWGVDNDDDTKNTAGSTDSTSKLYLIGAASQAANPQTYSDAHVFETNGAFSAKTLGVNADTDNDKVTLQYNSTDDSLDFIFA